MSAKQLGKYIHIPDKTKRNITQKKNAARKMPLCIIPGYKCSAQVIKHMFFSFVFFLKTNRKTYGCQHYDDLARAIL